MLRGWGRPTTVAAVALLLVTACGGGDEEATPTPADTGTATATPTTTPTDDATTADDMTPTAAPTTDATTAAATAADVAPTLTLDDPVLAEEPPGLAYRAVLAFGMTATLPDGSVQEGSVAGDGGKLINPDGSVSHAMIVDVEGLVDLPDCFDIAGSSPNYVSAYHTFYGGLSGDAGGDLTGEAELSESGITTNGVLVDRYAITLDNIDPEAQSEYATLDDAAIDVARDGGHVVRLTLNGLGRNNAFTVDQSEPRQITYELDFTEFGEITEFTTPADCVPG